MKKIIESIREQNRQMESTEVEKKQDKTDEPVFDNSRRSFLKKTALGGIALGGLMSLSIEDTIAQATSKVSRASSPSDLQAIDVLTEGDVYVADSYGKIIDGTLIGDNLGNSIYAKSNRGVIFNGSVRDMEGLGKIEGFNGWIKGADPSYIMQMSLTSINAPIRIGRAIVLPGDVVLAKKYGVIFIPAHLVEDLVITSEVTALRDQFGHQRLREGMYKPGQIDSMWSEEIRKDFINWLENYPGKLPMTKEELNNYFKERNW